MNYLMVDNSKLYAKLSTTENQSPVLQEIFEDGVVSFDMTDALVILFTPTMFHNLCLDKGKHISLDEAHRILRMYAPRWSRYYGSLIDKDIDFVVASMGYTMASRKPRSRLLNFIKNIFTKN